MTIKFKLNTLIASLLLICNLSLADSNSKILNYTTNVTYEDKELIVEKSFLIEIASSDTDWLSDISIYYDKTLDVEILEAVILDQSGKKLRKLSEKEITTRSNFSYGTFYQDGLVKQFSLKWNEYPYRIKYRYRESSTKFISLVRWYPAVYNNVEIANAELLVDIPADYPVSMSYDDGLKYSKETGKKNRVYHSWSIENHLVEDGEYFSPPTIEMEPKVMLVPRQFNYGVPGSSVNWQEYGNWHENLNAGLDQLTESEKRIVDDLLTGVTDAEEKVKILYNYMQDHTRYINVSIDVGGMKPYPASYVCKNKYGDCKALTIYMKAMLNYIGISSHYTVIKSGQNPTRIDPSQPAQQFDHVILSVPMGSDTIWLENTSSYSPYNYLGSFTQDRLALLVDGEKSKLVRTPAMTLADVLESRTYRFQLDEDGKGKLQFEGSFNGAKFGALNEAEKEAKRGEQQRYIEALIGLRNGYLSDWEISIKDRNVPNAELVAQCDVSGQFRNLGDLLAISLAPVKMYDMEKPEERTQPIRITMPVNKVDSVIYQLPFLEEYAVEFPAPKILENQFGRLKIDYAQVGHQLIVARTFQLNTGDFEVKDYAEFYDFFDQIKKYHRKSKIILKAR
ncbi:MAG: DUF3857 domain-containing protein [Bacteroidota bacterium]